MTKMTPYKSIAPYSNSTQERKRGMSASVQKKGGKANEKKREKEKVHLRSKSKAELSPFIVGYISAINRFASMDLSYLPSPFIITS